MNISSSVISFAAGATQGTTECLNITFIEDNLTEQLECFMVGVASNFLLIPVCIEDNNG